MPACCMHIVFTVTFPPLKFCSYTNLPTAPAAVVLTYITSWTEGKNDADEFVRRYLFHQFVNGCSLGYIFTTTPAELKLLLKVCIF